MKPLAIDLYCGLGGWAEGFLSEGWRVIGFDIERFNYPGELIVRDVLTIHGSELKDADCFVASPPCQEPSYRAMPWSRAQKLNRMGPPHKFIALFEACFRIRLEASVAAGRKIPLIVENVRGARRWVGWAKANYGSYYLWGDVPADLPPTNAVKICRNHINKRDGHAHTRHLTNMREHAGIKQSGISGLRKNGKGDRWWQDGAATFGSKSSQRKLASAQIAKIPFPLSQHIAKVFAGAR